MRITHRILCGVLTAALTVSLVTSTGVLAADDTVPIDQANFPDAALRAWLLDENNLGGAGADGLLTGTELSAVTDLRLAGLGIADLSGIQHFTALESLTVKDNALTSLDMSGNPRLRFLHCANNALTSLNVTGCPQLVELNCEHNRLETLDLSGNPALVQLYCRHNDLKALDVSHNPELAFIETFDNRLEEFDCSMLKKLKFLHIDFNRLTTLDMSGNPSLEGNGFVAANNHLTSLTLPAIPNFRLEASVFYEQNPLVGYDRVEWFEDPGFTRPVAATDLLEANGQTLYAYWVPNPYTVYYRANGGTGNMEPQSAVYGSSFALRPNTFTRTGYTFTAWSNYSDGVGGQSFPDGQTVQNLAGQNGSRTAAYLYAQWAPNPYTVRFDANGGEGAMDDLPGIYDAELPLPDSGFSNASGVFVGWALAWMQAAEDWYYKPAGEVLSSHLAQLEALVRQLADLDDTALFFCDPDAVTQVPWKARLAREKADAVAELDQFYTQLLNWEYLPENQALLEQARQMTLREIESADSSGMAAALLVAGKASLEQVDPVPKDPGVTAWPAAAPLLRGQALADCILTGGQAGVAGSFSWKAPDLRPQTGGEYIVLFVPQDTRRYRTVEGTAALTVKDPPPRPSPP